MKFNPVTVLLLVVFLYPIIRGFIRKFSSEDLKADLSDIQSDIAFIISLMLGLYLCRKVFQEHETGIYSFIYSKIPGNLLEYISGRPILLYVAVLPILVIIIFGISKSLFLLIDSIAFYPLFDLVEDMLKRRGKFNRSLVGALFEIPKAISYILVLAFILNFISMLNTDNKVNSYLEESKMYSYLCDEVVIPVSNSKIAKQLPKIINNSFKIEVKQNQNEFVDNKLTKSRTVIYYNGVTLEDGIKSSTAIDKFAKELVAKESTDREKAKKIYGWIGANIAYDYDKANKVLNNDFNIRSGAVPAFESKSGICFDYSCLYVAMSRAVGLNVKLVTGEGFNGVNWVGHAWNQVYLKEENKWINIDTTFYHGGNYFGSKRFDTDHRDAKVVGEW